MNIVRAFTYNRSIARRIVEWLVRTPLTPNVITTISMVLGLLGAYGMSGGSRSMMLLGALALHLSFIMDDCDGEVARRKGLSSTFGMWYDYIADFIVDLGLWVGLTLGVLRMGIPIPAVALGVAACIGSLINLIRVSMYREVAGHPEEKGSDASRGTPKTLKDWIELIGNDGDPSTLIWILALIGNPGVFLILGCVYVHFLWVSGFAMFWIKSNRLKRRI